MTAAVTVTVDAEMHNAVMRQLRAAVETDRDACQRQAERAASIGRGSEDPARWETIERTWHAQADALTRTLDRIDTYTLEPEHDSTSTRKSSPNGSR